MFFKLIWSLVFEAKPAIIKLNKNAELLVCGLKFKSTGVFFHSSSWTEIHTEIHVKGVLSCSCVERAAVFKIYFSSRSKTTLFHTD